MRVSKNIIHGPCGILNPISPCMVDEKCSKSFPRLLVAKTISGNDSWIRWEYYAVYPKKKVKKNLFKRPIHMSKKNKLRIKLIKQL